MKVNRMVLVAIAVGMAISSTAQAECTTNLIDFEDISTTTPVFGLNTVSPLLSIYGDEAMEVLQEDLTDPTNPSILAYNSNVYGSNGAGGENWLPGDNAKSFGNASTVRGATSQDLLIEFNQGIAVASFAIDIADFGDWFPNGGSDPRVVSLKAYDSTDNLLIEDTLSLDYSLSGNDVYSAGLRNLAVTVNDAAIAYVTLEFEDLDPGVSFDNIEFCVLPLTVNINVHPSSDPNPLNLSSGGTTPVAIFGSAEFDVTDIIISTLTFADSGVKTVGKAFRELCSISDIGSYDEAFFDNLGDPDGYDDIVCHFVTAEIVGLPDGTDLPIKVQGDLIGGGRFEGTDLVKVKNSDL